MERDAAEGLCQPVIIYFSNVDEPARVVNAVPNSKVRRGPYHLHTFKDTFKLEQENEVAEFLRRVAAEKSIDLEAWEQGLMSAVLSAGARVLEGLLRRVGCGRMPFLDRQTPQAIRNVLVPQRR